MSKEDGSDFSLDSDIKAQLAALRSIGSKYTDIDTTEIDKMIVEAARNKKKKDKSSGKRSPAKGSKSKFDKGIPRAAASIDNSAKHEAVKSAKTNMTKHLKTL